MINGKIFVIQCRLIYDNLIRTVLIFIITILNCYQNILRTKLVRRTVHENSISVAICWRHSQLKFSQPFHKFHAHVLDYIFSNHRI